MSIHRPKRANTRRPEPTTGKNASSAPSKAPKWKDVVAEQPDDAFAPYDPATTFAKDALVTHSKFGKGVVVEVDGNKVQILFEEGIRKLMHSTPA